VTIAPAPYETVESQAPRKFVTAIEIAAFAAGGRVALNESAITIAHHEEAIFVNFFMSNPFTSVYVLLCCWYGPSKVYQSDRTVRSV
jgi:hypothetical protein